MQTNCQKGVKKKCSMKCFPGHSRFLVGKSSDATPKFGGLHGVSQSITLTEGCSPQCFPSPSHAQEYFPQWFSGPFRDGRVFSTVFPKSFPCTTLWPIVFPMSFLCWTGVPQSVSHVPPMSKSMCHVLSQVLHTVLTKLCTCQSCAHAKASLLQSGSSVIIPYVYRHCLVAAAVVSVVAVQKDQPALPSTRPRRYPIPKGKASSSSSSSHMRSATSNSRSHPAF